MMTPMMTPQEKAEELVLKYLRVDNNTQELFNTYIAKQCALIAVDELIIEENRYNINSFYPSKYWQEVKNEIIKI
jgi:hypothetical protein